MGCLAHTEAVIDFGDDDRENDVTDAAMSALVPRVHTLRRELQRHLQDGRRGELVREGIRIALAGPPNAGEAGWRLWLMLTLAVTSDDDASTIICCEFQPFIAIVYCLHNLCRH